MFSCFNDINVEQKKSCRFKDVSPCRELVSNFICNEHAAIFGLTYKTASYQNGNNDVWTNIETYISSSANFSLPLFLDPSGEILTSEIHAFALAACNSFPNIRVEALKNVIACYMGMNAYDTNCSYGGWLDEDSTRIIVQDNNNMVKTLNYLPALHKMLLHYTKPSTVRNTANDSQIYLVPNLSLQYDINNSTQATYQFIVPNKKILLKWTNKPDCVATPIVLNAIRENAPKHRVRAFKPLSNANVVC
nr:vp39 [Apis mellifera nudivirus]